MTKRSFFRRAAAIIAAVALAPEIAFNVRMTPPAVTPDCTSAAYVDFVTDRVTAKKIEAAIRAWEKSA